MVSSRQWDIRNRVIAPIFKHLGIIDQWGNGLKIIANELKSYPEIEFKWFEKGLQFQVQFIKKNYKPVDDYTINIEVVGKEIGAVLGLSWEQVGTKSALSWNQVIQLLEKATKPAAIPVLMKEMGWKDRTKFRIKYITPLLETELLKMTIPEKPKTTILFIQKRKLVSESSTGQVVGTKKSMKEKILTSQRYNYSNYATDKNQKFN